MTQIDSRIAGGSRRSPGDGQGPSVNIAYLSNQYPMTSTTFVRREVVALEAMSRPIPRYSIRRWSEKFVDPRDESELQKTRVILDVGAFGLAMAFVGAALRRPARFLKSMRLAARIGRRSGRGTLLHLIYLAEACELLRWCDRDRIDHIHVHFGTNSAAVAMLCRVLGGPSYSFTVHGPEEFDQPQTLSLGDKIHHSAFVVGISEFGRSQLCRWAPYDEWEKIRVVHCGLDAMFLDDDLTPPPSRRRLACVGRLAEQKGQLILIEAAAQLDRQGVDFELVLAGDGPMRGEIERLIARFGLEDRVKLLGWQSNREVHELLRSSRAMVLPSFAEGLPVVIMEALALGRPVISTYVAGIPELVRPGETGWLVPASSVDELASAMREALDAPVEDLARMGRLGAERVARDHDIVTEAGTLLELIERSAAPRPRVLQATSPG